MATKHPRINFTASPETAHILGLMAKQKGKSVSAIANSLIEQAIEDQEDAYWLKIAHERATSGEPYLSHEEVWKDLL